MKVTDEGLVLREHKVGENSRLLTLLTRQHGIITGHARGSLNPKSKLFSASGRFCYSQWVMREGQKYYWIDEAAPLEVFYGLHQDLDALALATYISELAQILSPTGEEAARLLQLTLNSLYLLSKGKKSARLVKAVYELRALADSGFMPNLLACEECGRYEDEQFFFDTRLGTLLCGHCAEKREIPANLTQGSLAALRHIVLSDDDKVYNFTIGEAGLASLSFVAEQYLLFHLDRPPKSLDFLKSLL